jgi:UDP-2,4-diacetamido-2,4,6-trideoxy-beta-L-altropyranose hydrolase
MRCLALAQAWQDAGGRAVFAMVEATTAVRDKLLSESCKVLEVSALAGTEEDSKLIAALAREHSTTWVVVDGYQFTAEYQMALKSAGLKILFLDDFGHARHYSADVVLNQNAGADERPYQNRESYTQLLLGPGYAMLRREFLAWQRWKRAIPKVGSRILVAMGGSDPANITALVLPALQLITTPGLEATVVVGGSNPHADSLKEQARDSKVKIRILTNVDDMPGLMAWADVALSAAGSICWEMCAMGLPALLLVTADNQRRAADALTRLGAAQLLAPAADGLDKSVATAMQRLLESSQQRECFSLKGRELVDARGAAKVVRFLQSAG